MNVEKPSEVFTAMLHAIDRLDWPAVRRSFADRVRVDYSSLGGEPAGELSADDLLGGWRALLPGFDATQHLTGPVLVTQEGSTTVVGTHVRGYHYISGAEGGHQWMVAGHYTARLVDRNGAFRITALTLTMFYQEGNLQLPALARARAASSRRAQRS